MDWKHFNVHFRSADVDGKATITALSKEDAKRTFELMAARDIGAPGSRADIPFEAIVTKVIGPLGLKPSTNLQLLAHKYGQIMRNLKGAEATFSYSAVAIKQVGNNAENKSLAGKWDLVDKQFAKLKRDIRDLFKAAGLNVK